MRKLFFEMVHQRPWTDETNYEPNIVEIDSRAAMSMASCADSTTRTKHVDLKYHHVRELVGSNIIDMRKVDTRDQVADCLTKPGTTSSIGRLVAACSLDRCN